MATVLQEAARRGLAPVTQFGASLPQGSSSIPLVPALVKGAPGSGWSVGRADPGIVGAGTMNVAYRDPTNVDILPERAAALSRAYVNQANWEWQPRIGGGGGFVPNVPQMYKEAAQAVAVGPDPAARFRNVVVGATPSGAYEALFGLNQLRERVREANMADETARRREEMEETNNRLNRELALLSGASSEKQAAESALTAAALRGDQNLYNKALLDLDTKKTNAQIKSLQDSALLAKADAEAKGGLGEKYLTAYRNLAQVESQHGNALAQAREALVDRAQQLARSDLKTQGGANLDLQIGFENGLPKFIIPNSISKAPNITRIFNEANDRLRKSKEYKQWQDLQAGGERLKSDRTLLETQARMGLKAGSGSVWNPGNLFQ